MALFDTQLNLDDQTPEGEKYQVNSLLQKALFKESGNKTTTAKVTDFTLGGNIVNEAVGRDIESQDDVAERYQDNIDRSIGKTQAARDMYIGAAKTAGGIAAGSPQLAQSGFKDVVRGGTRYTSSPEARDSLPNALSQVQGISQVAKSGAGKSGGGMKSMPKKSMMSGGGDVGPSKAPMADTSGDIMLPETSVDSMNQYSTKPTSTKIGSSSVAKKAPMANIGGGMSLPALKKGAKLKGPSHKKGGIDLIDSITKEKVAEAEGEERIFSKDDTVRIEKAVKNKDKEALMKHVNNALKRQDKNTKMYYKDGGKNISFYSLSELYKELKRRQQGKSPIILESMEKDNLEDIVKNRTESMGREYEKKQKQNLKSEIDSLKKEKNKIQKNENLGRADELDKIDDKIEKLERKKEQDFFGSAANTNNQFNFRSPDGRKKTINFQYQFSFDEADKLDELENIVRETDKSNKQKRDDKFTAYESSALAQNVIDTGKKYSPNKDGGKSAGGKSASKGEKDEKEDLTPRELDNLTQKALGKDGGLSSRQKEVLKNRRESDDEDASEETIEETSSDVDPLSDTNEEEDKEEMTGFLQGALSAGNAYDLLKIGVGLNDAQKDLPEYEIPEAWQQYTDTLETMANEGLTEAERSLYEGQSERTYAYDIEAVERGAGGSAARYLGNAGAAAQRKYKSDRKLAEIEARERDRDLQQYGQALQVTNEMDRMKFQDDYREKMLTKKSGAQLAQSGFQGMIDRAQFNKTYGEGSEYDKLMELKTEQAEEALNLKKAQKEYYIDQLAKQSPEPGSAIAKRPKQGMGQTTKSNAKKKNR